MSYFKDLETAVLELEPGKSAKVLRREGVQYREDFNLFLQKYNRQDGVRVTHDQEWVMIYKSKDGKPAVVKEEKLAVKKPLVKPAVQEQKDEL